MIFALFLIYIVLILYNSTMNRLILLLRVELAVVGSTDAPCGSDEYCSLTYLFIMIVLLQSDLSRVLLSTYHRPTLITLLLYLRHHQVLIFEFTLSGLRAALLFFILSQSLLIK